MTATDDDHPTQQEATPVDPASLRPGMDVYDGGVWVGRVKSVDAATFLLNRPWRRNVRVSLEQVIAVTDKRVLLRRSG